VRWSHLRSFFSASRCVFLHRRPVARPSLSLHDALPISLRVSSCPRRRSPDPASRTIRPPRCLSSTHDVLPPKLAVPGPGLGMEPDRKSTRLNSSHVKISYAVFCLKQKNIQSSNQNLYGD